MSTPGLTPASPLKLKFPQSLAVYDDYAKAQKSVDFLADADFPVNQLMIVGTDLKRIERVTGRLTWSKVAVGGILSGLWFGIFIGLVFALFTEENLWQVLLSTAFIGATFGQDRMIYWSYSEARTGGNATSVARGRLSDDGSSVENAQVIFRALPVYDGDKHFGSSLAFAPDGYLFITLGERSDTPMRPQAQDLGSHMGKTIRINADGTVPQDNPYVGRDGALPEIWSLGHRNVQGIAIAANGDVWTVEHGTRGGDEINLDQAGKNYGWPDAAYGVEYRGGPINAGNTAKAGTEQPVYYWDPVIAPGGMTLYQGAMFPGWNGNLLVAGLKDKQIARLVLENNRVVGEERLLTDLGERVRYVAVGSDGAVWAITDEQNGKLVRLATAN